MAAAAAERTASTHSAAFVTGTHQLEIVGYSALKALGGSHSITSADFRVAGHGWAVLCCFDDHRLQSLSLIPSTDGKSRFPDDGVKVMSSFAIHSPSGKPAAMEIGTSRETKVFSRRSSMCTHVVPPAFDELEARYVRDDRLTVRCTVEVLREERRQARHRFVAEPPPANITGCLAMLLDSGQRADVTFAVEDSNFDAHKLVLAARSPVFRAKFFGDTRDSSQCWFRIHDMAAAVFQAMLHFIYTDELPPDTWTEGSRKHRAAMASDLLVAADLYDVERLRLTCEKMLGELSVGDVATALATLVLVNGRHSCHQLEAFCVDYIADKWEAVTATEEYTELKTSCPAVLYDILEKAMASLSHRQHSSPSSSSSAAASSSSSSAAASSSSKQMSKSVYRASEVWRGSHQLTIMGFSDALRTHAAGESIRSGTFHVGGHDWGISCYPSGYSEATRDHIGVFLQLRTRLRDGRVKVEGAFTIGDGDTTTTMELAAEHSDEYTEFPSSKHSIAGIHRFVSLEAAKSLYVDQQDRLTIRCDVKVRKVPCSPFSPWNSSPDADAGARSLADEIAVPPPNISRHLEQLLETRLGSDVAFLVEGTKFHAHTLMLSMQAPALLKLVDMAATTARKKKKTIRIDGIKAVVFKAMLHFIYTDELPPLDELVRAAAGDDDGPMATRRTRMAGDLLAAADRFQLRERMGPLCENLLCDVITPQTVAATLTLAEHHRRPELKAFCADYVSSPGVLKAVVASEVYKGLKASSAEAEALGRIMECVVASNS
ncbi:hypothetical protein ACP70R_023830 [Stipagrostis hirtigluma subsp. patula]